MIQPDLKAVRCLVYNFGIRDVYVTELALGRLGCEVVMLDCTVNYQTHIGPNASFYPWCIGDSETELQIADGKTMRLKNEASKRIFKTLPQVMAELGHTGRELTLLKMDCEGCEWGAFVEAKDIVETTSLIFLEAHYVKNAVKSKALQLSELSKTARQLQPFDTMHTHWNAVLSLERDEHAYVMPELTSSGVVSAYAEFVFVNRKFSTSPLVFDTEYMEAYKPPREFYDGGGHDIGPYKVEMGWEENGVKWQERFTR